MKYILSLFLFAALLYSCEKPRKLSSTDPVNWEKKMVKNIPYDSLETGSTFLSIYSQIFLRTDQDEADLTATVSLHNPNITDTIYIAKAVYYNTTGTAIRTYFDKPIFVRPMETVQIVIDGVDNEGGTGANFIFDWQIKPNSREPLFEAVMISTYGQQGISFVTEGKRVK
ncbi:MAG: hypothetical protein CMC75_09755 [Flavobacteriaceae bacterium]|nr:hypothetical protein [Flavobacteriaceae bacterium]|tara:strand:- start:25113 stop:25622 length:510 start_codon:yes stop_codon:yes gene_type:complete